MTREDEWKKEIARKNRQDARKKQAEKDQRPKPAEATTKSSKEARKPPPPDPLTEEQKADQAKAARIAKAIAMAVNAQSELRATVIPAKPLAGIDDWFVAVTDEMPDDQASKLIAALPQQGKGFVALYGVQGDRNINVAVNHDRVEAMVPVADIVKETLQAMEDKHE